MKHIFPSIGIDIGDPPALRLGIDRLIADHSVVGISAKET